MATQKKNDSKRSYNSPLREQQSAETREKIVSAGAALVHTLPDWDWKNLTAGAVGEKAGVSERTVRRYFSTEAQLRDEVLKRLVEESGMDLDSLKLNEFGDIVAGLFLHLQSFAATAEPPRDSAFESLDQQRRNALRSAVARVTPDWSDRDRETVTAALDILWHPPIFERLSNRWGFENDQAIDALKWLFEVAHEAIRDGRNPRP